MADRQVVRKQTGLQPAVGRIAESGLVEINPPAMEKAVQGSDYFRASTHLDQHYLVALEHRLDQSPVKAGKLRRREYSGPTSILPGGLVEIGETREDLRGFLACAGGTESARSARLLIQTLAAPDLLAGIG
jgi:hypothetical protein